MRLDKIREEKQTLSDAFQQFMNVKKASGKAPITLKEYRRYGEHFISNSHNTTDYKVLQADVVAYFSAIPDTSPARYNHPYQYLSAFFNYCVKQDILPKNPITANDLTKKRDDGNIKPASIEDIKILMKSFDQNTYSGLRNYTIIMLMLDTGIRTSELVRLKNEDFDESAKQITISKTIAKTRKNRVAFLSAETTKLIKKIISIKPAEWEQWLFPTRDGLQMQTHGLSVEFMRKCKTLNISITPYQLRHSFATYFVKNGGNIFALQNLMGHSDIRMTRRYTDMDDNANRLQHSEYTPLNLLNGNSRLVKIK